MKKRDFAEITDGVFTCTCHHEQPDPRSLENIIAHSWPEYGWYSAPSWFWTCPRCQTSWHYDGARFIDVVDDFTAWPPDTRRERLVRTLRYWRLALSQLARGKSPVVHPPF